MPAVNRGVQEMNAADEQRMKRDVLQSSSVVCTTLNHSGASLLLDVLKPFSSNGRKTVSFGCVIVDEVQNSYSSTSPLPLFQWPLSCRPALAGSHLVSFLSRREHLGICGTGFYRLDAHTVTQPTVSKH